MSWAGDEGGMWGRQVDRLVGLEGGSVERSRCLEGEERCQGQTSREGHSVWNGELGTYIWVQSQDGWLGGSSWPRQILPNREVWEHRLPEHSKR